MERCEVLVVGGGNAGISLAARLIRNGASDITVVAPSPVHRYKPLLNYVGGGQATMADLERPMRDVVPDGCVWIRDAVEAVDPAAMTARTRGGRTLSYATLVLCPGLVEDWDATPGLRSAYGDGWAASTYVPGTAPAVWSQVRSLRGGSVVFTVPPEPASCAPTALKPLLLACDHWRRAGVLEAFDVRLVLPDAVATGVPEADALLDRVFASYGVEVIREARIERVDPDVRSITVATPTGLQEFDDLAFAHAVPHHRAPRWIADSGLSVQSDSGLVDIDPATLRHRRQDQIWAIGDAANVATRPSGGALRHQVDILARNLSATGSGGTLQRYDGYTVMPITVARHELLFAEVDRESAPKPSLPFVDPIKPRRATWFADRYVLPQLYWRRLLKGKV